MLKVGLAPKFNSAIRFFSSTLCTCTQARETKTGGGTGFSRKLPCQKLNLLYGIDYGFMFEDCLIGSFSLKESNIRSDEITLYLMMIPSNGHLQTLSHLTLSTSWGDGLHWS